MRSSKECDVIEYINTAANIGLNVNDDVNGESSVELASNRGLHRVLILLLDLGCPLKKAECRSNAVVAAIRNGQHTFLWTLSSQNAEQMQVE
eukprot:scaffold4486_cov96-Skeletonema_dohrnii-CCMP3373.AAC.1